MAHIQLQRYRTRCTFHSADFKARHFPTNEINWQQNLRNIKSGSLKGTPRQIHSAKTSPNRSQSDTGSQPESSPNLYTWTVTISKLLRFQTTSGLDLKLLVIWASKVFWPFFTQISGRNFLPEFCGEVHPQTAAFQALCCALCSTEQSTFRGGEKGQKVSRKGEEEGWPAKGAKKKKGHLKIGQF